MDPTHNLTEQRAMIAKINAENDKEIPDPDTIAHYGILLAELMEALDTWIKRGGALPAQWVR